MKAFKNNHWGVAWAGIGAALGHQWNEFHQSGIFVNFFHGFFQTFQFHNEVPVRCYTPVPSKRIHYACGFEILESDFLKIKPQAKSLRRSSGINMLMRGELNHWWNFGREYAPAVVHVWNQFLQVWIRLHRDAQLPSIDLLKQFLFGTELRDFRHAENRHQPGRSLVEFFVLYFHRPHYGKSGMPMAVASQFKVI